MPVALRVEDIDSRRMLIRVRPEPVLKYLARYTHRVAISNHRLIALDDGEVTLDWKDYAHEGKKKTMTLKAIEFIRRFLLHVLLAGFVRIRFYGFLANRVCRQKLEMCRALLKVLVTSGCNSRPETGSLPSR